MNEKKSIEKAREYFSCDRFATENGITLDELDEAHSLCSVTLEQGHRNAFGIGCAVKTELCKTKPRNYRTEKKAKAPSVRAKPSDKATQRL